MAFPKKCLSIDIGNNQIKIADVVRSGERVKILNYDVIPTPKGAFNDGFIIDKPTIAQIIKDSIKKNKFKSREVIFTVVSSKIITREVELPNIPPSKLKNIIDINSEEYFPVNLMDYTLGHTIIETIEENGEKKLKVNVIAALTSLIEEYVELSKLAEIKIAGIDYAGNSLGNFIKKEKLQGTNIVLDFGYESTMVSIVKDGVVKFNRNLLYGSGLLLDCIKKHFEVDDDEAVRISRERPLLDVAENENPYLSNDITGAMNQILNGITRLVDYYSTRNNDRLDGIYIVGGGSGIAGADEYIEKFFNIPTKKTTEIKSYYYKGNKDFNEVKLYFGTVAGACFSDINLVPKALMTGAKANGNRRTLILFGILILLVGGYFTTNQLLAISKLTAEKGEIEENINNGQYITELKTEYQQAEKKNSFRNSIIDESTSTTQGFKDVLVLMEEIMPSQVVYLDINNSEDGLSMSCVAKDSMTVAKLIENLKAAGYEEVNVPTITTTGEEDNTLVSFAITCQYPKDDTEGESEVEE